MKIIGLDLSLRSTGWCVWKEDHRSFDTILSEEGGYGARRIDLIANHVMALSNNCDLAVIEDLAFNQRSAKAHEAAGLSWVIRVRLWRKQIPVAMVAAVQLKKFATGSGRSDKSIVLREVYRRWQAEAEDDHQADAITLCQIGKALYSESVIGDDGKEMPKYQQEVLAKIRKRNHEALAGR